MTRLNDTPHSANAPKKADASILIGTPRLKPIPLSEQAAPALKRLRSGETILLSRKGRDVWSWEKTGASVGKRIIRWLRENDHLVELSPAMFPDQPGQEWGMKR